MNIPIKNELNTITSENELLYASEVEKENVYSGLISHYEHFYLFTWLYFVFFSYALRFIHR